LDCRGGGLGDEIQSIEDIRAPGDRWWRGGVARRRPAYGRQAAGGAEGVGLPTRGEGEAEAKELVAH
jgi:hypothetical protein